MKNLPGTKHLHGMKHLLGALPLAAAAALPVVAHADDESPDKWYLAPMLYGTWISDAKRADDDISYGLAFGRNFGERLALELGYTHGQFDGAIGLGELKQDTLSLDALLHFYRGSTIHPYLSAGLYAVEGDRDVGPDGSGAGLEAGLGILSNLYTNAARTSVVTLRAEVKNRWLLHARNDGESDGQSDTLAGIGLQFQFGAARPLPAAVVAEEPTPPPAPEAPRDADGDGVVDAGDRCPDTPTGAAVDANGCELDADGDGVVDRLDRCPATPAGVKVDAAGCEIEEIVLRGVTFDTDRATLAPTSIATLDGVVALLKQRPDAQVEIRGHTDSVGSEAYNRKLSERRARAVVDYLVAQGIPAGNLAAKGLGESQPVAANDTPAGREQNRRVTLQFTGYVRRR
jgi:OOP family OmpA-OmpF porin